MNRPGTDLLPAIFDEIVSHYQKKSAGPYARSDIVEELLNGIIDATVARVCKEGDKAKKISFASCVYFSCVPSRLGGLYSD